MAKIFISDKRNIKPDAPVAEAVYQALRQEHKVFIDSTLKVGEKWAERIQTAIKQSEHLICFLSEHSVNSEMVIAEIEAAYHQCKAQGCLVILPVRLAYSQPFTCPLLELLNGHPYLTRKALYLLAMGRIRFDKLWHTAGDDAQTFFRLRGQVWNWLYAEYFGKRLDD